MDYIRPLDIPVIFVTAKHEVRDRIKGLRLGADDYLVKPFDMISSDEYSSKQNYGQNTGVIKNSAEQRS